MVRVLSSTFMVALALVLVSAPAAAQQTVLLDFSLATCGPCRQMDPVVSRLQAEGFEIRQIDGERQRQIAAQYQVDRYPTFVFLSGGREVNRFVGVRSYAEVRQMLLQAGARPGGGLATTPVRGAGSRVAPATFATPVPGAGSLANANRDYEVGSDLGPVPEVTIPARPEVPSAAAATLPQSGPGPDPRRLLSATVRIKVADGGGSSFGTGTIIDSRQGEALIVTCAHLFRNDANPGKAVGEVAVELFQPSATGVVVVERVAGQVLSTDPERDVALMSIRCRSAVQSAKVASAPDAAVNGGAVWSVGCDHGDDPTVRTGRITTTNRYQSPPSLTATGAPVVGRSGGGLFNEQGELVGVCFGASEPDNEGFYAKLSSVHAELDKLSLTAIYREEVSAVGIAAPAALQPPAPTDVAEASPPPSDLVPVVQTPATSTPPVFRGQTAPVSPPSFSGLSPQERAALEELTRRASDSEIVCVIRPHEPGGKSEVITLDRVSPQFLQALKTMRSASQHQ